MSTTKRGISASRAIVSAFGSCASGCDTARASMWKGYGRAAAASGPGFRERALPRVPAGAARAQSRAATSGRGARRCSSSLAAQTPERVRASYADVYRELRAAGYTAVGEFHYLGLAEAHAAAEAAAAAGIELVLLHVAYARGGIERFRQESVADYLRELEELRAAGVRVGVAPHSVRACPREWLEELGRYAGGARRCRCTSTPTSSRARSRSASPSTGCGRSSCSTRAAA